VSTETLELLQPEMEATHYGTPVAYYGEDGAMIALGHLETRRALAVFNRHARAFLGFDNLADDRSSRAADWAELIEHRWAAFRKPNPNSLYEDPDWVWVVEWAAPDQLGAQPVTVLAIV
jgi:hypothetical protein